MTSLENTKGIGDKIRSNFLENYDKAFKDIIENIEKGEDK